MKRYVVQGEANVVVAASTCAAMTLCSPERCPDCGAAGGARTACKLADIAPHVLSAAATTAVAASAQPCIVQGTDMVAEAGAAIRMSRAARGALRLHVECCHGSDTQLAYAEGMRAIHLEGDDTADAHASALYK